MIYTEKLKEIEFWKRTIENQVGRYDKECGVCNCRKLSSDEIKKYCERKGE